MAYPCACGDPSRKGLDHTPHVCITSGLFTAEDFAAIDAAAEGGDDAPRHGR